MFPTLVPRSLLGWLLVLVLVLLLCRLVGRAADCAVLQSSGLRYLPSHTDHRRQHHKERDVEKILVEVRAARDLGLHRTLPLLECHVFQTRVLQDISLVSEASGDLSEFENQF